MSNIYLEVTKLTFSKLRFLKSKSACFLLKKKNNKNKTEQKLENLTQFFGEINLVLQFM